MKTYRCPVRDQIGAKGFVEEVRAYVAAHRDDPGLTDWINDRDRCDQQAKYLGFVAHENAVPFGKTLDEMPRTGKGYKKPLFTARNLLVNCPIHGKQILQIIGNHATEKLSKKRSDQSTHTIHMGEPLKPTGVEGDDSMVFEPTLIQR
jgi:hypothetical protein